MSDSEESVVKSADKAMSFNAILAAISAGNAKAEELANAREERLYQSMAQSRVEILGLVS